MTAVFDAKDLAAQIRGQAAGAATALRSAGTIPTLAVVTATEDESAAWYVRSIQREAEAAGIAVQTVALSPRSSQADIEATLAQLAADLKVHGILLQAPLPDGVSGDHLATAIPVEKDVDGLNPLSTGLLDCGREAFAPATALAVLEILKHYRVPLTGRRAVVVGRSRVVGKPVAQLLLAANATVTICHSKTNDLPAVTREADILVSATGEPRLITADHIQSGVVIIDVGTTADESGNVTGDADAAAVQGKAAALTPVPGGVGPVTTALLLRAVTTAARNPANH